MLDPIIITGLPRSRTSLVTQIMELSGVFLGQTLGVTKANPHGQLENIDIINKVQKKHLREYGFDTKGQKPIPPLKWHAPDPNRKQKVFNIMKSHGLEDQIWGFKDAKACLDWRAWHEAFPNAYWIVTERNDADVIKSCLRTSFMTKYKDIKGWQYWIDEHKKRFQDMFNNLERIKKVNTDNLICYNFDAIEEIIEDLSLNFDYEKVYNQIQPI